ncbi:MAG: GNAT family N-acetyltransferase [Thermoanaerobaculia bacterium]|nr:GNAT family N-acetyltransferase [Thermoanaerobaculia bacterium]
MVSETAVDLVPSEALEGRQVVRRELHDQSSEDLFDGIATVVEADHGDVDVTGQLTELRTGLSSEGRLLLAFRDVDEVPPQWVRVASELGFVVLYALRLTATPPATALLVLQPDENRISSYREGDETGILELFQRSFHHTRSVERWAWAYRDNPWSGHNISVARTADGKLAAHYAGYGMPFWYQGRTFTALQIGDTMTDPEFRGVGRGTTGLMARTVRHFFSRYRNTGFGFFYGFNTGPIQRFSRWFIGGMEVEPVHYRRRNGEALTSIRSRYRIRRVNAFDSRSRTQFDRFFSRAAPAYGYLVRRDGEYVDWRYLRCPDVDYQLYAAYRWGRLVGWSVFRSGSECLVWGDALFAPRHHSAASDILAQVQNDNPTYADQGIEAWFPARPSWWHEQLRALGFEDLPNPSKLGFMILPDAETEAPLEHLYYSMGDGDLF